MLQLQSASNQPTVNGARLCIELHAYFDYPATVGLIGYRIALGVNLLKGLLGGIVLLQFEHVDGIGHPDYHIYPATGTLHLSAYIDIEH